MAIAVASRLAVPLSFGSEALRGVHRDGRGNDAHPGCRKMATITSPGKRGRVYADNELPCNATQWRSTAKRQETNRRDLSERAVPRERFPAKDRDGAVDRRRVRRAARELVNISRDAAWRRLRLAPCAPLADA